MSARNRVGTEGSGRLGILLVLLALAAGAYWWMGREHQGEEESGNRLESIRAAAEGGDAAAAWRMGRLYAEGLEVEQDWLEAARWYRKSAQGGDPQGQYQLGRLFEEGKGVGQDWKQAAEWYRRAAEQGYADAEWKLGLCFRDGHGVSKDAIWAKIWLEKAARHGQSEAKEALERLGAAADPTAADRMAAEGGDAEAQCRMGRRCLEGDGVEKDEAAGAEWYRKSAEQGHAEAQCRWGDCLRLGRGVAQDAAAAERWYLAAAEKGHAAGQRSMGKCRMAAGDRTGAVTWLQQAAEGGDAEGQYLLAVCFQKGLGTAQDTTAAKKWLEAAAENGYAKAKSALAVGSGGGTLAERARRGERRAQYELGRSLLESGKEKERAEGLSWLQSAAQGGFAEAAIVLGRHFAGKNPQQSFYWWHRAADSGSVEAQWRMVDLCRSGTGTSASDTEALRWARKVAESGDVRAIRLVARCYENGVGCRQDYSEARQWYARAGDQYEVDRMTRLITGRNIPSPFRAQSTPNSSSKNISHYRDSRGKRHTYVGK